MNESRQRRKMHADEVPIADSLVRRLIDAQFPHWSDLTLWQCRPRGRTMPFTASATRWGAVPRIHWAVSQVDKEWNWLRSSLRTCRLRCRFPWRRETRTRISLPLVRHSVARG